MGQIGQQMGALKMREWKMQEWKMREHIAGAENAGVENAGATKYGKPSEKILQSTRRNMAVVAFLRSSCQTQLTSESAC